MRTCLIYGQNGLDLCVTFNCYFFYKEFFDSVVFSTTLFSADVLIILRGIDEPLKLKDHEFSKIFIYDYVGWPIAGLIKSIDKEKLVLFTASNVTKNIYIEEFKLLDRQIYVDYPPVKVSLWSRKIIEVKYDFVHVGNFKKVETPDDYNMKFHELLQKLTVHIWGMSWPESFKKITYHGKAPLFIVPDIYRMAHIALGIMYPFQREVTFSSRFWQGPLNGCLILSEPGGLTKQIPGILETDFDMSEIKRIKKLNIQERMHLKKQATDFWENHFESHKLLLSRELGDIKSLPEIKIKKRDFLFTMINNKIRICLHLILPYFN